MQALGQRIGSGVCCERPLSPSVFVPQGVEGAGGEAIKTWPPAFHLPFTGMINTLKTLFLKPEQANYLG